MAYVDSNGIRWEYTSERRERERQTRIVLSELAAFAAACKTKNTDEWMQLLANHINRANEILGDSDRVEFSGSRIDQLLDCCETKKPWGAGMTAVPGLSDAERRLG